MCWVVVSGVGLWLELEAWRGEREKQRGRGEAYVPAMVAGAFEQT